MLSPQAAVNKYLTSEKGNSLSGTYRRCFEIIAANNPVLREKAYRLRYQIYCCEHRFESREAHPNQLETDEYDYRSIQSLIINRTSGEAIGTVRLILPDQTAPESSFPIQKICSQFLSLRYSRSPYTVTNVALSFVSLLVINLGSTGLLTSRT